VDRANSDPIAVDSRGRIYTANGKQLRIWAPDGTELTDWADNGFSPTAMSLGPDGSVIITERGVPSTIVRYSQLLDPLPTLPAGASVGPPMPSPFDPGAPIAFPIPTASFTTQQVGRAKLATTIACTASVQQRCTGTIVLQTYASRRAAHITTTPRPTTIGRARFSAHARRTTPDEYSPSTAAHKHNLANCRAGQVQPAIPQPPSATLHAPSRGFSHGPWRARTSNLGIKSPLLYQLS
jgi:hypothetical protein